MSIVWCDDIRYADKIDDDILCVQLYWKKTENYEYDLLR